MSVSVEQTLGSLELYGVDATPGGSRVLNRIPDVQHLVIHDELHGHARHRGGVEDPAENDGMVRGVVVTERPTRGPQAPTEVRAGHEAVEVPKVDGFEDIDEVVVRSAWGSQFLAAPSLADGGDLRSHVFSGEMAAVAPGVVRGHRPSEKLRKKDECESFEDRGRRFFQDVSDAYLNLAVLQLNEGVRIGEIAESKLDRWKWGSWAKHAENPLKDAVWCFAGRIFRGTAAGQRRLLEKPFRMHPV